MTAAEATERAAQARYGARDSLRKHRTPEAVMRMVRDNAAGGKQLCTVVFNEKNATRDDLTKVYHFLLERGYSVWLSNSQGHVRSPEAATLSYVTMDIKWPEATDEGWAQ